MVERLSRILAVLVLVNLSFLPLTNAYFVDKDGVDGSFVSSGCWLPPSVPAPLSPADNSFVGGGSSWFVDPLFDWSDSTSACPLVSEISYQYESYSDPDLLSLVFRSGWLSASQIPAPQVADGTYYWRSMACDNFGNCSSWSPVQKLTIDTTAPSSEITSLSDAYAAPVFSVNYLASGDNLDYVALCYSWNLTPWVCSPEFQDRPHSPGSFQFTSPKGDGTYYLTTIAHDLAGNSENKNLTSDPLEIISYPSTSVDTLPPTTNLDRSSFPDHWSGQNLLVNPWQVDPLSTGDHLIGSTSVAIGFSGAPQSENALDAVYLLISLPGKISSHLSFWFRGFSQDTVDFDQFEVQIRRPDDYLLEKILSTGSGELPQSDAWFDGDSGWRWLTHPLLSYSGQTIKIWFGVTNHDPLTALRTWVELKDVEISSLDPRLSGTDPVNVDTHDTGTGVDQVSPLPDLVVGENNLSVGATDVVQNSETPNSTSAVVLPDIVLNQISFGDDQFIKLYNNSLEDVDLTGWSIAHDGQILAVTPTIISSKSFLTIEDIDESLFDFNDAGGTVDLLSPSLVKTDSTTYFSAGHDDEVWQRLPEGLGNWGLYFENVSANISFRLSANRITLTITNLPSDFGSNPSDRLDYEIKYTRIVDGSPQEQGIAGSVLPQSAGSQPIDRDFYLGSCSSGGACTPDTGLGPDFILSLTGQAGSESVNIHQTFTP